MKQKTKNWLGIFTSVLVAALMISMTVRIGTIPAVSANTQASVSASVSVQNTCEISLANSIINFGTLAPGTASSASNDVTDTNGGNEGTYVWVDGGNWIGNPSTINFYVTNTEWNGASFTPNVVGAAGFNSLTLVATNTAIFVPASSSNNIYFGLYIPSGQTANVYSQTINAINVC